ITYLPAQGNISGMAAAGPEASVYNKIEIPPGGQYCVVLPDSTRVWLNAGSSLRFPVRFASNQRRVELSGEGYFEVAANKEAPFHVSCLHQEVEVLGTHFNIHAYSDEAHTVTTLLTGSIRVNGGGSSILLRPDQQADLYDRLRVQQVDAEDAVAWKNGYFRFDDERLETIMKSIGRWYNVGIDYENEQLKDEPYGILSARFANLSALLKLMEQTGSAHFSLEGSIIHIKKKN
ncbi:MAG: FecR domain-containing protein, partial [Bacteroidota bacterium]